MNNIKLILNWSVFGYVYRLMCFFLLPFKNKKKILFYSTPDMADNSWELFKQAQNECSNYTFIWLVENVLTSEAKVSNIKNLSSNKIRIVKKFSLVGLFHFMTSSYAFTTTVFYPFVRKSFGPVCVNLWHGMPIKKIGILIGEPSLEKSFSYAVSTSQFYSSIMSQCLGLPINKFLTFGNPKNDAFIFPVAIKKNDLLEDFTLPVDSKIIFWMPTFRKAIQNDFSEDSRSNSFLDEWDELKFDKLNQSLIDNNISLLIKLHPMDALNNQPLPSAYSNISFVSSDEWRAQKYDLYEALSISDGLISDISSVLIDYLVTRKPIAITRRFEENYERGIIPESAEILKYFIQLEKPEDFTDFLSGFHVVEPLPDKFYLKYNEQAVSQESSCKAILNYLNII